MKFKIEEVAKVPTPNKRLKIPCLSGGFYFARIHKKEIYFGGATLSEPIYKTRHKFKTDLEAELYARLQCAQIDLFEIVLIKKLEEHEE